MTSITNTALIFEGGGMRASYTAAVANALLAEGLDVQWIAGISAGSSNAVNYVSRDAKRTKDSFVALGGDPRVGNWRTWLRGDGLFNAHYIYQETGLPGGALPFNYDAFDANPAQVNLGAFEADTGSMVYWTKDDIHSMHDLMVCVQSSSTMPMLMPPVTIGDHIYVDGAIGPSGGIPLDAAKAAGFDRFLIVCTRPRGYVKRPFRLMRVACAHFRRLPAVADAMETRHVAYNATLDEINEIERSGAAQVFYANDIEVSNSERNVARLQASYDAGAAQVAREMPAWKEWLADST